LKTTRTWVLLACACAALAGAGVAGAGIDVGVTEDAGKAGNGAAFFATLGDVGLKVNRISINWDPAAPTKIAGQAEIAKWLPQAQVSGTRIIFAVAPAQAKGLTATPEAKGQFIAFVQQLAATFPTVKDYVIGNEPNRPYFWVPQYSKAGKPLAAAQYLPVLAGSYDALKAKDPTINVIGVGLSPRGNDLPQGKDGRSRSPVRFLDDLGRYYRLSGRKTPIMDELAFHPYPQPQQGPPSVGYAWPTAGLANLNRIKQAVWDAFNGTAQPTFAETGKTFTRPLRFDLDEVGWQVPILPALAPMYHGTETPGLRLVSEATQADYYADTINAVACDPTVRMLSFFHLVDETDLDRWQSAPTGPGGPPTTASSRRSGRRTATARGGRPSSGSTRPASSRRRLPGATSASRSRGSRSAGASRPAPPSRPTSGPGSSRRGRARPSSASGSRREGLGRCSTSRARSRRSAVSSSSELAN
jgi:hypothetical protein